MTAPLLGVSGVSKRFGGIRALEDVSLAVRPGEALGVIGPNGAGKTTLFDCISGVTQPERGTISFAGRRIDRLPIHERARLGIGRTFQRLELFTGMTVRDHFAVAERERRGDGRLWKDLLWRGGLGEEENDRVEQLLRELHLEAVAEAPIESLSLGQGRLVVLGRALIQDPVMLLLDEPSSGLDSKESAELAGVLCKLRSARSAAILLVEHDIEVVHAVVERAVVLDFGRVIAEGPLDAVLAEHGVRTAYLGERV